MTIALTFIIIFGILLLLTCWNDIYLDLTKFACIILLGIGVGWLTYFAVSDSLVKEYTVKHLADKYGEIKLDSVHEIIETKRNYKWWSVKKDGVFNVEIREIKK